LHSSKTCGTPSQPTTVCCSCGEILRSPNTYQKQKQADGCGISLQSAWAGFLNFIGPWLSTGPVCGLSSDTCTQPPILWGRLPDFHGTLAFHTQKCLGRFVDLHVTLAVSLHIAQARFLIFMGPWPSTPRSASAGLWIFT